MEHTQSPSMHDVAKAAGVSTQTVSRVANDSTSVRPETRQRVLFAMNKLGYRPNYAARALKRGRFRDIGVVISNIETYGNTRILKSIARTANDAGYAITLLTMRRGTNRDIQTSMERMKQLPVDGVIFILDEKISDFAPLFPSPDLPLVLYSEVPSESCPTIDTDQYGTAAAIVDYFLTRGHRTVYHIAGPSTSMAANSRIKGWKDSLLKAGREVPPVYLGDWESDSGYQAGLSLASKMDCTAIFAANDQMAYGAMQGLAAGGKTVPADVSIIGFDDSLVGIVPRLNLTTMRPRFEDIGQEAFTMIKRQCEGEQLTPGEKIVIPSELIERQSVRTL